LRYSEGTYEIAPVLDGTYLKADMAMHRKEDPTKERSFLIFTTFNPQSGKYEQTYFYSRWALRVTETGEYDSQAKEYRTTAFVALEDGTRDENVRTITRLSDPNNIVYTHYSRYADEKSERMDVQITLTRVGHPLFP